MKYANGCLFIGGGKQVQAFVCAKTFKRMKELLSAHYLTGSRFQSHWSKIGNDEMKAVAMDKEGIWVSKNDLFIPIERFYE